MIRVRVRRHLDHTELIVSGHAGSGPYGEDLVCAAVSALVETLALGLEHHGVSGAWTLEEGRFSYDGNPGPFSVTLDTFLMGFASLAQSHGDFVRYEEDGR